MIIVHPASDVSSFYVVDAEVLASEELRARLGRFALLGAEPEPTRPFPWAVQVATGEDGAWTVALRLHRGPAPVGRGRDAVFVPLRAPSGHLLIHGGAELMSGDAMDAVEVRAAVPPGDYSVLVARAADGDVDFAVDLWPANQADAPHYHWRRLD